MSQNLANGAQGVRRQDQVGVQGYGGAAVPQPRGQGVDVQAALQPVTHAAVAARSLDSGPGGARYQPRFRDPLGYPAGRGPGGQLEYSIVGPTPGHRPEGIHQLWVRWHESTAGRPWPGAGPGTISAGPTARAGRRAWRPGSAGPAPVSSSGAAGGRAWGPILQWQTSPIRTMPKGTSVSSFAPERHQEPTGQKWQTSAQTLPSATSHGNQTPPVQLRTCAAGPLHTRPWDQAPALTLQSNHLVVAAWLNHRFAQIHPFPDGNGRVTRARVT